ncbi:MAG: cation transporter [Erysipelotrichaceae bacterium]|nr:cation transporter [Erysipelotrichaceae bacterium]
MSEKEPDREHPFGYGRIEYLSSMVIGSIIVYAGIEAIKRSVSKILHPEPNDYSLITLAVISVAIIVKVIIGIYMKNRGRVLDSQALIASGKDAMADSISSAAVLLAAIIYLRTGHSIEAWVGLVISLVIIRTGIGILKDAADVILGKGVDTGLAAAVKKTISSFPEVEGVYDIVIHSYGREKMIGSAHIEISDRYRVSWVDNLQRAIIRKVRKETGVEMLGISIYAINTRSKEVIEVRETIRRIVLEAEGAKQMHGFYLDTVDKTMSFDVVLDFGVRTRKSLREELQHKVLELYPEYDIVIDVDYDFTE